MSTKANDKLVTNQVEIKLFTFGRAKFEESLSDIILSDIDLAQIAWDNSMSAASCYDTCGVCTTVQCSACTGGCCPNHH